MAPLNQCCWSFCCHDCYTNCSVYFLPASHRQLLNSPKNLDEPWYPLLDPNLGVSKPSYTCILLLNWAKINFTFPHKMHIFFPIITILFDIFEMFRISKSNRAFTKYMIEIANYAIMPLKGFLLGIFLSVWSSIAQVLSGRQIEDSARMSISPPMGRLYDK